VHCLKPQRTHTSAESGFGPSSKGRAAKNLYFKSERPTFICRITWVWSARLNLNNRQIIIQVLPRETRTYPTQAVPGPLQNSRAPVIFTGFHPPPLPHVGAENALSRRHTIVLCMIHKRHGIAFRIPFAYGLKFQQYNTGPFRHLPSSLRKISSRQYFLGRPTQ
jgi:hypothetical protein